MVTARSSLPRIVGALQETPDVRSVWIGGSVREGRDDEVSDLDIWLVADTWSPESIGGMLLSGMTLEVGGSPLFHGVDREGVILDIRHGPTAPPEYIVLEAVVAASKPQPGVLDPANFRSDFWLNSYKHRKPLWRGLDAMVLIGFHFDRLSLIRAWVEEDTGASADGMIFNIHGLTSVVRDHLSADRMAILGLPLRDRSELVFAIQKFRGEMQRLMPSETRLARLVMDDPLFAKIARGD